MVEKGNVSVTDILVLYRRAARLTCNIQVKLVAVLAGAQLACKPLPCGDALATTCDVLAIDLHDYATRLSFTRYPII